MNAADFAIFACFVGVTLIWTAAVWVFGVTPTCMGSLGMVPVPEIRRRSMAEQTVDSASDARTVNNTMRHQYRILSDEEKARMAAIKDKGAELLALIESCGNSRELSIARTKTEEAVMWAVKHVTA